MTENEINIVMNALSGYPTLTSSKFANKIEAILRNHKESNKNENFTKLKIFAYENSEGDKGIICAANKEEAETLFHEEYPDRKIVENSSDFWDNGAYLFEVDCLEKAKLYCCFSY